MKQQLYNFSFLLVKVTYAIPIQSKNTKMWSTNSLDLVAQKIDERFIIFYIKRLFMIENSEQKNSFSLKEEHNSYSNIN